MMPVPLAGKGLIASFRGVSDSQKGPSAPEHLASGGKRRPVSYARRPIHQHWYKAQREIDLLGPENKAWQSIDDEMTRVS